MRWGVWLLAFGAWPVGAQEAPPASSMAPAQAQIAKPTQIGTVDLPTRPGVTQRMWVITPTKPKAAVVLYAGGLGILQLSDTGVPAMGGGNFLVRTRALWAEQGLMVVVLDAPSDRQQAPYLGGFRQTAEHVQDAKAVIAWVRQQAALPVWLVGTSRGTQSVAFIATELNGPEGPDGLVLTATILSDDKGRAVPQMALHKLRIPVLVVHHELDACKHCSASALPGLMAQLSNAPSKALLLRQGGITRGDACEAWSYHGFNGIEADTVAVASQWLLSASAAHTGSMPAIGR